MQTPELVQIKNIAWSLIGNSENSASSVIIATMFADQSLLGDLPTKRMLSDEASGTLLQQLNYQLVSGYKKLVEENLQEGAGRCYQN